MPDLMQYPDRAVQAVDLAEIVAEQVQDAIAARGQASLALPGGTTPARFLRALAEQDIDWPRVSIMPTDERFVGAGSARSNTRLLRETLLQGKAEAARLLSLAPLGGETGRPEALLPALTGRIAPALPLDVAVLGMGADMHMASLFPGAQGLEAALAADAPPLAVIRAEAAPEPRLTLTAPVFGQARAVHLLITGPEKLAALQAALLEGPEAESPVRVILSRDDTEIHYAE